MIHFEAFDPEIHDQPIGILEGYNVKEWRVHVDVFHFKFKCKGHAINFCVKHDISLERLSFFGIARVILLNIGDPYVNEKGEVRRWGIE